MGLAGHEQQALDGYEPGDAANTRRSRGAGALLLAVVGPAFGAGRSAVVDPCVSASFSVRAGQPCTTDWVQTCAEGAPEYEALDGSAGKRGLLCTR